jgi:hypothetical protein
LCKPTCAIGTWPASFAKRSRRCSSRFNCHRGTVSVGPVTTNTCGRRSCGCRSLLLWHCY